MQSWRRWKLTEMKQDQSGVTRPIVPLGKTVLFSRFPFFLSHALAVWQLEYESPVDELPDTGLFLNSQFIPTAVSPINFLSKLDDVWTCLIRKAMLYSKILISPLLPASIVRHAKNIITLHRTLAICPRLLDLTPTSSKTQVHQER